MIGGLQEAAAQRFEGVLDGEALRTLIDAKLLNEPECRQNVSKEEGPEYEPPGSRTLNLLIKSQLLYQLS